MTVTADPSRELPVEPELPYIPHAAALTEEERAWRDCQAEYAFRQMRGPPAIGLSLVVASVRPCRSASLSDNRAAFEKLRRAFDRARQL